jgi:hypothetical protein
MNYTTNQVNNVLFSHYLRKLKRGLYKLYIYNMAARKTIFNANSVASHLDALKAASGDTETWWEPVLKFEWNSIRSGGNSTQYLSAVYTDTAGVSGQLKLRINSEVHVGQIMPNTDAGVAELAARVKNPDMKVERRTKKPTIQIQKWTAQVKTDADGITILKDSNGEPVLPADEFRSAYYTVAAHVNEAFNYEARGRIVRGNRITAMVETMKRADKAVKVDAVIAAFVAENGPLTAGSMIVSTENANTIRRAFPADNATILKMAIVASNCKVANLVQEFLGETAKKNAGAPLPNPMTRISMNFKPTGESMTLFFDKSAPYLADGKQKYEAGKIDGVPINADNIHLFIKSRSVIDGIVNMTCVCFSSMGISMPTSLEVAVVQPPMDRAVYLDDVYEDTCGSAAPAAGATPATTALCEEDADALIDDMTG